MIKQDMCWFNYRTLWCCGMYPSTMGNIWIMMINYQWWGFTNYLLCLTWGIPQLQQSFFQRGITLINKWIGYSVFRHTHIVASKKCQTMFFQNGSSIWKRRPVSSRVFLVQVRAAQAICDWSLEHISRSSSLNGWREHFTGQPHIELENLWVTIFPWTIHWITFRHLGIWNNDISV